VSTVPLGEARDHLSEMVAEVQRTHERVTITRHGKPAVVLLAAEDLEALEETMDLLTTPGALEEIRTAEREIQRGEGISGEELAQEFLRRS